MSDAIERIEEQLSSELDQLNLNVLEQETRLEHLKDERDKVSASLSTLRGEKVAKRGKSRSRLPYTNAAEIEGIVRSLIVQNGPCPEEDLIGLVEDHLRKDGKSLAMAKVLFNRVKSFLLTVDNTGNLLLREGDELSAPKDPCHA